MRFNKVISVKRIPIMAASGILDGGLPTPAAPPLTAPAAVTTDTTPTFTWGAVAGAATYDLQVDDNSDFSSPIIDATAIATNSYTPGDALATFTTLYARVRGVNAGGTAGAWSATLTFTVEVYLIRDQFTINRAAGAVNGTEAEPGPGTRVVTDPESKMPIASSALTILQHTTFNNHARIHYTPSVARQAGLMFRATVTITTTGAGHFGLHSAATEPAFNTGELAVYQQNAILGLQSNFGGTPFGYSQSLWPGVGVAVPVCFIVRSNGGHVLVNLGGTWIRAHVSRRGNAANLYAYLSGFPTGASSWEATADDASVIQLAGIWSADDTGATSYAATTTNAQTFTHDANGIVTHWITAQTGVTQELMVRRTDDDNTLIVRCDQANSKIYLYEKSGGVETERGATGGVAQTWTDSTQYEITVATNGTSIIVYVNGAIKINTISTLNQLVTGGKVSHAGTYLEAWPRVESRLPFDFAPANGVFGVGDSKTYGVGDTGTDGTNGYLTRMPAYGYQELPSRLAKGGWTVAMFAGTIQADLAAISQYAPRYILLNLGSNDIASGQAALTPATWQANLGIILDALHQKFPSASVRVMRIWRRNTNGQMDDLNDVWIPAVLSTRSDWASLGPDERIFLENGDNGATYTGDGIHPNEAGYTLTAQQWLTFLT